MAAAAHTLPSPLLNALAPAIPFEAAAPLSTGAIESVINGFNTSWLKFVKAIDYWTEFTETSPGVIHQTITTHLNDHLPVFFSAVSQLYELKSKVLTGDQERDEATIDLLYNAVEIKKELYMAELDHLIRLCPIFDGIENGPVIMLPAESSLEEIQKKHPGQDTQKIIMRDLAASVEIVKDAIDNYPDYDLDDIRSQFNHLLKKALRSGIVDQDFSRASKDRRTVARSAIEALCSSGELSIDIVEGLTNFFPNINSMDLNTDDIRLYDFFDDRVLFKFVAGSVGDQLEWMLVGMKNRYGANLSPETLNYFTNHLPTILQTLYRQHFTAAMPGILKMPLPEIRNATVEFFQSMTTFKTNAETEVAWTEEDVSLEDSSLGAVGESEGLSPFSRLLTTNIMRSNGQTAETTDANDDTAAPPSAPMVNASPAALMQNAGIVPPQPATSLAAKLDGP